MTLDQAAEKTKIILKWGGILLGLIFIIFIVSKIFSLIFPASQLPPQVAFGKLYPPDFPNSFANKTFSYTQDTISGKLPIFPTQEKIFKMAVNTPDLLALSKAQNLVGGVGFTKSPTKISENIYQWRDENSSKILTMNIQELNFNLISDFLSNSNQPFIPKETDAPKTAEAFLRKINLFPADLNLAKTKTLLFFIKNYSLVAATSLSNTQAIQVSFFQKDFNDLPIYYTRGMVSPLNFLVGETKEPEVVEANFFYQTPSSEASTYPIKTASVAFNDLKKGKAYIASYDGLGNKVSIKNISLGYYMSEKKQDYLLPIVVFEGNDGFLAYEFAVTDEWVNK